MAATSRSLRNFTADPAGDPGRVSRHRGLQVRGGCARSAVSSAWTTRRLGAMRTAGNFAWGTDTVVHSDVERAFSLFVQVRGLPAAISSTSKVRPSRLCPKVYPSTPSVGKGIAEHGVTS